MKVAEVSLRLQTKQKTFFKGWLDVEDIPEDVSPDIDSPSEIELENYFARSGTTIEIMPLNVDVEKNAIVKGVVKDTIKAGYNNNNTYDIEIWLLIETIENENC